MKVFVKTMKGTHFEIEVNPQDTVADVKKQVETSQGRNVYPADQQMLIHQGKILKDKTTLDENKVSENSFLVIMLCKTRGSTSGTSTIVKAPANQAPPTGTVPPNPSTLASHPPQAPAWASTPVLASAPAPTATAAPAPAVAMSTETDVYGQAASNLVAGNNFEQVIQQILDMGGGSWDRDTIVRALRAAYNNPERAVEYLYSGIPEHTEAVPVAQTPTGGQPSNVPVQALQPARVNVPVQSPQPVHANVPIQASQPARVNVPVQVPQPVHANVSVQAPQPVQTAAPSSGPNASPLDLFPEGLPSVGSNTGMGSLDFLRNSPQFRALQTMVQANPQILQPMLQELGKQNPNVMRLIQEHQAEFLRLINEPSEGAEGNLLGQLAAGMQQTVIVSQEEREAIERLEAMGFDRTLVLEVFFACNKNEGLAANYLLDHMHEFEE